MQGNVDYSWSNVTDSGLRDILSEAQQVQDDKFCFLDLSGNRLSLQGLKQVVDFLQLHQNLAADLSSNSFGFADAYRTLEQKQAVAVIKEGRVTFDPKGNKAIELIAARLFDTKGNLDDLRGMVTSMRKAKDESAKEWKGWRRVESDAIEEQVSNAIRRRLDPGTGEVIRTCYRWKGIEGDLDGLVIGNLDGTPVYVLVEAKHNVDASRRKAVTKLRSSSEYFDGTLLSSEIDEIAGEEDVESWAADKEALQVERLQGRKRFWAFGGVQFKEPEKLQMKGKCCFMVHPNHDGKYDVVGVYKDY